MAATKTKPECKCPKCKSFAKSLGGTLCYYKQQIMHKQYRTCPSCGFKFVTYKDNDNNLYLNDKIIGKGRPFYSKY